MIKYIVVTSIFMMGLTTFLSAASLKEIVEQRILESKQLEDKVQQLPESALRGLGRRYCMNRMADAWRKFARSYILCNKPSEKIRGVSFLGDTSNGVAISNTGKIRWFSVDIVPACIYEVDTHRTLKCLSVSKDGNLIAVAAGKTVLMYDSHKKICIKSIEHDEEISTVSLISSYMVVGGVHGKVWLWDLAGQHERLLVSVTHACLPKTPHLNKIQAVSLLESTQQYVSVMQRSIKVWSIKTGQLIRELKVDVKPRIWSVHFIDNARVSYSFTDGTFLEIDLVSDKIQSFKLALEGEPVSCQKMLLSPNEKFVVTGGLNKAIYLWEKRNSTEAPFALLLKYPQEEFTTQMGFRKDGLGLMTGGPSGILRYWSIDKGINITLEEAKKALS